MSTRDPSATARDPSATARDPSATAPSRGATDRASDPASATGTAGAGEIRYLPPRPRPIARATDLGSVQVLKHGNHYLLTDAFGDIHPDSRGLGLYGGDTRLLSCSILRIQDERLVLLQGSVGANYRGVIVLTNPSADRDPDAKVHPLDEISGRTVGISRERVIGAAGLRERLRVVNHLSRQIALRVELELDADLADIFEVRGYPRQRRGTLLPIAVNDERVSFRYDGLDGVQRRTHIAFSMPATSQPVTGPDAGGAIRCTWTMRLEPGGVDVLEWSVWSSQGPVGGPGIDDPSEVPAGVSAGVLFPPIPAISADEGEAAYREWLQGAASVDSDHELFDFVVHRAGSDLRLLINDGPASGEHYVAAGVPWFSTLFGRDAIITALQTLAIRPQLAVQTLEVLAAYQATNDDPDRDAEPGKILHELRTGEMAGAGELPHTPYFGSIDSTPLWLMLLGATFDWTGDREMLDRLWPNALAALDWIDRSGDRDDDGFVEYERRSDHGLVNQGWKDSSDAIRDRTGAEVPTPIALAEVQGYVYAARRRMAELARVRGDDDLAERLDAAAEDLRRRFEEAFWVADQRYYAMALDGSKRPADAIGSNAGQCLFTGIVDPERARDVADRLFRPSMFSGWGIRTFAADQPGYNPIGYHTGSVWPHDTSLIAAGLKRYGLDDAANRLAGQVLEAAQRFPEYRLPELFCGFDRDETGTPVPYPVACSPQAWAAGAPFLFLTTMLGLEAHADRRELELRHPHLPDWLSRVTVRDVRVGDASVDLLFHRWRGTTSAEVLRKSGDLAVTVRL